MVTGMMVAETSMSAQATATGAGAAATQGEQAKAQDPGMSAAAALVGPGAGALVGAGAVMKGAREGMLVGTAPLPACLQLLLLRQQPMVTFLELSGTAESSGQGNF